MIINKLIISELWKKVVAIGTEIDVEIRKPRTTTRSQYRSNAGSTDDSAEIYYRQNVYLPFLDHCISKFQNRYDSTGHPRIGQLKF